MDVLVLILHSGPSQLPPLRTPEGWLSLDRSGWVSNKSLVGENELLALAELEGIDVILSGHTHQTIAGLGGAKALVVQPGYWGSYLSHVSLELERHGGRWQVIRKTAQLLAAEGIPPDPQLLALTEPYHQATLRYIRQPIGHARCAYRGGWQPAWGPTLWRSYCIRRNCRQYGRPAFRRSSP